MQDTAHVLNDCTEGTQCAEWQDRVKALNKMVNALNEQRIKITLFVEVINQIQRSESNFTDKELLEKFLGTKPTLQYAQTECI